VVEGFRPSTYSRERHAEGRYRLDGAHRELACRSCHLPGSAGSPGEPGGEVPVELLRFRFPSTGCRACHRDPHEGRMDRFLGDAGCVSCHATESWPSLGFDHALTGTPLSGAHLKAPCRGCHGGREEEGGEIELAGFRWKGLGSRCSDCHADPHAGQFRRGEAGTECERCHEPAAWKLLIFDHEGDAAFSLKGKHREVPCASCHPREESGGRSLIRYRPRPVDCRGCHGRGAGRRAGDEG
jgi:hypothetical protein